MDRVGRRDSTLTLSRAGGSRPIAESIDAADHRQAAKGVIDFLKGNGL